MSNGEWAVTAHGPITDQPAKQPPAPADKRADEPSPAAGVTT